LCITPFLIPKEILHAFPKTALGR